MPSPLREVCDICRNLLRWQGGFQLLCSASLLCKGFAKATQSPTRTPTNTGTATPTPLRSYLLAGYMASRVSTALPGTIELLAFGKTALGEVSTRVELYYLGAPTGVLLRDGGDGMFTLTVPYPAETFTAPGSFLFELLPSWRGTPGYLWPYLVVE